MIARADGDGMLTLDLENVMLELDDGTIKHVGASDSAAAVSLYDATDVEVRPFGDSRVKIAVADGEGNEIELALTPTQAESIAADIESLEGNIADE